MLSLWCILGLMTSAEQAMAKLTVTKPKISTTPYSGLGKKDKWELACGGYYTYITVDSNGDTQVYVNDDGGGYSNAEKYRVELPEEMTDWSRVSILGAKSTGATWRPDEEYDPAGYTNSDDVCASVHIKMTGGLVSDIVLANALAGSKNYVRGDAELIMTGGTIHSIYSSDAVLGNISISLSNIKYTGSAQIFLGREEATLARTTLFINNNSMFYTPSSRYKLQGNLGVNDVDVTKCKSAIIPDPADDMTVHSFGPSVIPAGHSVDCNIFYYNNRFTLNGYLNVRKCDGFKYNGTSLYKPAIMSDNLSVKPHQQIDNRILQATCTRAATYRSFCDVCGTTLTPSKSEPALGHDLITDDAVAATCVSPGLTAGEHCARCGLVTKAQSVEPIKGHKYKLINNNPAFTACFGRSVNTQICEICLYVSTTAEPVYEHEWVLAVRSTIKPGKGEVTLPVTDEFGSKLAQYNRAATCTTAGVQFFYCKKCHFIKSEEISAKGHNLTSHATVPSTCEESGLKAYSSCSNTRCRYMVTSSGIEFKNLDDLYIAPLDHKYGVTASYVKNEETHVSDATCSDDELYHQSCSRCGHINEDLYFIGEKAKGHDYYIKSIDFKSANEPESGIFTMGCHACDKTWPNFQFSVESMAGEFEEEEYDDSEDEDAEEEEPEIPEGHVFAPKDLTKFHGYCIHTTLESVDVIPTCVPGHGTYRINFYFNDKAMTATYDNFVRPSGYVHNYGPDGICHETHFKIQENLRPRFEGEISKDRFGNIIYELDQDGFQIPDYTEYSAKATIAVPTEGYYLNASAIIARKLWNNITGEYLTYPEWRGSSLPAINENLPKAINDSIAHWGEAVVALYDDLDVNSVFDLQQPGLTLVHNGHDVAPIFADGTVYKRMQAVTMPDFTYSREFDSNVFAAYFVPFALSYNDWKDQADIYELVSISQNAQVTTLGIRRLGEGSRAIAGTPYIIKPKEAGTMLINAHDVTLLSNTIRDSPTILQGDTYSYIFTGTKDYVDIKTDTNMFMSTTGGLQYYGGPYQTWLKPQRWYMTIRDKANNLNIRPSQMFGSAARILVLDDDDTTGIEQIETNDFLVPIHEAIIYDLQGRRLDAPRHGINIVNGKKVVM